MARACWPDFGVATPGGESRIGGSQTTRDNRFKLEKRAGKVSIYDMNVTIANDRISDMQAQAHEMIQRQLQESFGWMDDILDVHRSNFVFRAATKEELEQHKTALKLAIRFSNLINALIADPEFREPALVRRLQVRIQQLQDAYDTFHDPQLSEEKAYRILQQVFPE